MKTVLCYGDSNTWGYNPRGGRYDHTIRWPTVMAALLNGTASGNTGAGSAAQTSANAGGDYWVVEEGLNGRTTCLEDPIEGDRNGLRQLIPILRSHRPLDLVIIMLGTNDLKHRFNPSVYDIAHGAQLVAKATLASECGPGDGQPKVLMVCPAPIAKADAFAQILCGGALEMSRKLPSHYKVCAKECGAAFFDAGTVVSTSSAVDGIHWEVDDHRHFAEAMAAEVRKLLG